MIVYNVTGKVIAIDKKTCQQRILKDGDTVSSSDIIITDINASVELQLDNGNTKLIEAEMRAQFDTSEPVQAAKSDQELDFDKIIDTAATASGIDDAVNTNILSDGRHDAVFIERINTTSTIEQYTYQLTQQLSTYQTVDATHHVDKPAVQLQQASGGTTNDNTVQTQTTTPVQTTTTTGSTNTSTSTQSNDTNSTSNTQVDSGTTNNQQTGSSDSNQSTPGTETGNSSGDNTTPTPVPPVENLLHGDTDDKDSAEHADTHSENKEPGQTDDSGADHNSGTDYHHDDNDRDTTYTTQDLNDAKSQLIEDTSKLAALQSLLSKEQRELVEESNILNTYNQNLVKDREILENDAKHLSEVKLHGNEKAIEHAQSLWEEQKEVVAIDLSNILHEKNLINSSTTQIAKTQAEIVSIKDVIQSDSDILQTIEKQLLTHDKTHEKDSYDQDSHNHYESDYEHVTMLANMLKHSEGSHSE